MNSKQKQLTFTLNAQKPEGAAQKNDGAKKMINEKKEIDHQWFAVVDTGSDDKHVAFGSYRRCLNVAMSLAIENMEPDQQQVWTDFMIVEAPLLPDSAIQKALENKTNGIYKVVAVESYLGDM